MAVNRKSKSHKKTKQRKSRNSSKSRKSRKSKSQKGGNPDSSHKKPAMPGMQGMPEMQEMLAMPGMMKGGSPASDLVMESTLAEPIMNDYISAPRIRDGSEPSGCQMGGSEASDMVMSQLPDKAQTVGYPEGFNVKGNINSLNTYLPSGGSVIKKQRKGIKSRKGRKGRKSLSKKNKKSKNIMRGGSDWISSQYSLGNINNPSGDTSPFSVSQGVDRNILMNPPTLGLAGSGSPMGDLEGGNVRMVGSPLV